MAAVGALFAMPLAGAAAHRFGSRRATAVTVVLFGLALPVLALAPGSLALGLRCCFLGAAFGALDVSMNAQGVAVEKHCGGRSCRRCTACSASARMAGAGAAALIAAAGIALLPHFIAVGALVALIGLAACRPMLPARPKRARPGQASHAPSAALLLPGIVALAGLLSEGAMADWSAVYLEQSLGAGTTMAAAAFAAFSLMMAAGRFTGDRLVARLGGDRVVRAGGALAATRPRADAADRPRR